MHMNISTLGNGFVRPDSNTHEDSTNTLPTYIAHAYIATEYSSLFYS